MVTSRMHMTRGMIRRKRNIPVVNYIQKNVCSIIIIVLLSFYHMYAVYPVTFSIERERRGSKQHDHWLTADDRVSKAANRLRIDHFLHVYNASISLQSSLQWSVRPFADGTGIAETPSTVLHVLNYCRTAMIIRR